FMRSVDRARRAWHAVVSAGAWTTALLSLSPGIGGLLLSRGIWEWRRRSKDSPRRVVAGVALAAGIAAAVVFFAAALVDPARADDGRLTLSAIQPSPRMEMWRRSFHAFTGHPIVGQGIGTGAETFNYIAASGEPQALTDAHNVWLSVAMQSGVLGLAAFIALIACAWRRSSPWVGDNHRVAGLKLALRCALGATLFFQGLTGSFEEARHIWLVIGLMVCAGANESIQRQTEAA
ncbi:MAG: O-antigen ligase family protein, partial [Vicinamibacterales bacterium]